MKKTILMICACLIFIRAFTQTNTLNGKISNEEGETLAGVSVIIKGSTAGTVSDKNGAFQLATKQALPITIVLTSVGYESYEVEVKNWNHVNAKMSTKIFAQELTLAATRVPTRIIESPVSIERIGLKTIQTTPATSAYDAIAYLKGVDFVTSSLTFKTPATRGFNTSGSARVNQWVDGMDNQAPGMNFSIGNFAGVTELDLESIELLPGASSALYGPGGMSGTIVINSKNPFKYPGFSVLMKQGVMNIDKNQRSSVTGYNDWAIRYAKVLGDRFAFKLGAQYLKATDWLANDSTNYDRSKGKVIGGTRSSDPNFDGINLYGDETTVNIQPFIPTIYQNMFPSTINVSRTGYSEQDIVNPSTTNLKLSAALHYKLNSKTEAIVAANWGKGTTVYTGADRYSLKNVRIGQYKLEIRNPNWFIRGYTTQEDAGDSYAATTISRQFNEAWKPSGDWYGEYVKKYVPAALTGSNDATAHALARAEADKGRPTPGSDQFKQILNKLKSVPISKGGGLFIDKTNLYMGEGQYNFGKVIPFAEVIIGGNIKKYLLNSQGTLFIDTAGKIPVNEVGAYIQATKKLINNRLTLAASARIDKNQNFAGKLTPRFSALIKVADNNNLRLSYQTAYRFPTTQQQFIKLQVGAKTFLLGGLPWIKDCMGLKNGNIVQLTPTGPIPYTYKEFKPETSKSFEIGYKSLIKNKLMVDVYGYTSSFNNFLGRINLYNPSVDKIYSVVTNSENNVKTHGFGLGFDYLVTKNLTASANYYSDKISDVPDGFVASYNTPANRINIGLSSTGLGKQKKVGFGIQYKWQDSFLFENDFANGNVEAFSTLDAQVNYKILKNKGELRIGGTNLLNHYYQNGFGNPYIGGLYYVGVRFDIQ